LRAAGLCAVRHGLTKRGFACGEAGSVIIVIRPSSISIISGVEAPSGSTLDAIFRRYRRPLLAFFRRRIGGEECDDLAQEVLLRLARRGAGDEIRAIEPYVFQTANNVLTDHFRSRAARAHDLTESYAEEQHAPADFSPERVLLGKEEVGRLRDAIEALPERARQALILFRFEGMKQAEIARHMGISVSAVEKHIKLGMMRIAAACREDA